ncbi:hypothetical protein [Massilia varians]|uniref:hypothetical protein n=1 Tax=Massilia varians TaxID=457921 RepID=UPI0025547EF4|nr:hypothetical protein [Massilia varians]MDK6076533.1 hypothetical protein [Massilia varians]
MKFVLAVFLMLGCTLSMTATSGERCRIFSSTDEVSSPMTIEEIEKQAMAELVAWREEGLKVPHVLFGHMNAHWLRLKATFQPGDEIVKYSTDKSSWQGRYGERGFALLRSGCIIDKLVAAQS